MSVTPARQDATTGPGGLSELEAAHRLAERPPSPEPSSRSYASIVRANVLTVFNLILAAFGTLTLIFADWRDALFLGILVSNAGIGIVQEVRAKRALDRLAMLVAPTARVVRDGAERSVAVREVVVGDLVRVGPGEQVVGDGELVDAEQVAVDESILTGESHPVVKTAGEPVRSGAFVVEGSGAYVVDAVGQGSYAHQLLGEARGFRHPRSPLERAMNRLLLALVAAMVPLGLLFGYVLWRRDQSTADSVSTASAGVVALVPEGLILLASLTYAVAALRIARRGALAQQLSAIESLASVDVLCTDKTGTLTEADLRVVEHLPAPGVDHDRLSGAIGRFAASWPSPNSTLRAIAEAFPATGAEAVGERVAFSSRTRWSGVERDGERLIMCAPEYLDEDFGASERAAEGRRVLAIAVTGEALEAGDRPPADLRPLGLVVLAERLRPDARETVGFLQGEGVRLVVLSGDAPATVAAIARDAGIPASGPALDGRELPSDPSALREAVLRGRVVGRISPEEKRRVVEALRAGGAHVAMLGDGVNDVPALKAAQLAVAQGTGSQMARSVADIVLVSGSFASIPEMVAEGRTILRNLQRVAKLFVAKSVLAAFLILTVGLVPTSYPFLPRHLTLASSLTIGIPAFFLALSRSGGPWSIEGFLRGISRFALPAGVAAGLGVVAAYLFALNTLRLPVVEARTVAVSVLVGVGLALVLALERPARTGLGRWVYALCGAMGAGYAVVVAVPWARRFFDLAVPGPAGAATACAGVGLALGGLWLADERFIPWQRLPEPEGREEGSAPGG